MDLTTLVVLSTLVVTMRIGERIRELRGERGLGVSELAEKAVVSRQYIYALESGERQNISLAIAGRLAAELGVTTDDLLGGDEPDTATVEQTTTDDGSEAA